MSKYEVIKEIPMGRFLCSFNCFQAIPIGTILESDNRCIIYDNGDIRSGICDIGSKLDEEHLRKLL